MEMDASLQASCLSFTTSGSEREGGKRVVYDDACLVEDGIRVTLDEDYSFRDDPWNHPS